MNLKRYILLFLTLIVVRQQLLAQTLDIDLLRKINLDRKVQLDPFYRALSDAVAPVSLAVPLVVGGVALLKKDSALLRKDAVILGSIVLAAASSTVLKHIVNRQRPFVTYPDIQKVGSAGSPSFPSGHTSDAFATATALSLAFPKWYIVIPAYSWAGLSGYSRMHLGVHYPSDVLAGALIGSGCAWLSQYANKKWMRR